MYLSSTCFRRRMEFKRLRPSCVSYLLWVRHGLLIEYKEKYHFAITDVFIMFWGWPSASIKYIHAFWFINIKLINPQIGNCFLVKYVKMVIPSHWTSYCVKLNTTLNHVATLKYHSMLQPEFAVPKASLHIINKIFFSFHSWLVFGSELPFAPCAKTHRKLSMPLHTVV